MRILAALAALIAPIAAQGNDPAGPAQAGVPPPLPSNLGEIFYTRNVGEPHPNPKNVLQPREVPVPNQARIQPGTPEWDLLCQAIDEMEFSLGLEAQAQEFRRLKAQGGVFRGEIQHPAKVFAGVWWCAPPIVSLRGRRDERVYIPTTPTGGDRQIVIKDKDLGDEEPATPAPGSHRYGAKGLAIILAHEYEHTIELTIPWQLAKTRDCDYKIERVMKIAAARHYRTFAIDVIRIDACIADLESQLEVETDPVARIAICTQIAQLKELREVVRKNRSLARSMVDLYCLYLG